MRGGPRPNGRCIDRTAGMPAFAPVVRGLCWRSCLPNPHAEGHLRARDARPTLAASGPPPRREEPTVRDDAGPARPRYLGRQAPGLQWGAMLALSAVLVLLLEQLRLPA